MQFIIKRTFTQMIARVFPVNFQGTLVSQILRVVVFAAIFYNLAQNVIHSTQDCQ